MKHFPFSFSPPVTGFVAIIHATVVPMDAERLLEDYTLIIKDGFIHALAPSSTIDTTGMQVIDATGKYIMPGLTDMHVHYNDPGEFAMFLASGVTLVRNMWGSPLHIHMKHLVEQRTLPGPHVVTTGPIIDGLKARETAHAGAIALTDPDQADALVTRYARCGYQQIKAYQWLTLEALHALGNASTRAGLRMVGHCPDMVTFEQAIEAGMTCFEHLTNIGIGHSTGKPARQVRNWYDSIAFEIEDIDWEALRRLAGQMADKQIWNCPTLVVFQPRSHEQSMLSANPLLHYEQAIKIAGWSHAYDYRTRDPLHSEKEWLSIWKARNDMNKQIVSLLYQEGVPLLIGTDTPNPYVYQGFQSMMNWRALCRPVLAHIRLYAVVPVRLRALLSRLIYGGP